MWWLSRAQRAKAGVRETGIVSITRAVSPTPGCSEMVAGNAWRVTRRSYRRSSSKAAFPFRAAVGEMKQTLLVGLGGCIGAIARFQLGGVVLHHSSAWR